jgi:predicted DCC family thiol-disulfide oxidoreductase YuxK
MQNPILLFDGVCNLCENSVLWIIKNEKKPIIQFASLQSAIAQEILENLNVEDKLALTSLVFVENNKVYRASSGALRASSYLKFPYSLVQIFWIVPKFFRDHVYYWVGRNRYRWFGKKTQCMVPTPDLRSRFLG